MRRLTEEELKQAARRHPATAAYLRMKRAEQAEREQARKAAKEAEKAAADSDRTV